MKNILTLLILNISICLSTYSQSKYRIIDFEKSGDTIYFSNEYNWYAIEFPEEDKTFRRFKKINPSKDLKLTSRKITEMNETRIKYEYNFKKEFAKCKKMLIGCKDSISTKKQYLYPTESEKLKIGDEYHIHNDYCTFTGCDMNHYGLKVSGFAFLPNYPDSVLIQHYAEYQGYKSKHYIKQNIDSLIDYRSKYYPKENYNLELIADIDGDNTMDIIVSFHGSIYLLLSYKQNFEKNEIFHLEDIFHTREFGRYCGEF